MKYPHLNPRQREAVFHGEGPLLILAGAGSGKTSTMAYRIAHLISGRQIPGHRILGLSFTNKAARELRERVIRLVSRKSGTVAARGLTIATFHSLCVRILRQHGHRLGFRANFSILDRNDQRDILREILRNIKIDERKFDLDQILFRIGQAKNRFLSAEAAEGYFLGEGSEGNGWSSDYAIVTASSFGRYQSRLKTLNAMDFDDLLFNCVSLLEQFQDVRMHFNDQFTYILVDEYQDTNPSQFRLLRLLTEKQQNLCVVGDDDQSIYAWRGADPSHILEFTHHYPAARQIILDQNYRSTTTILDAANQVITQNRGRFQKSLWSERGLGEPILEVISEDDRDEAEFVADEILRRSQQQNRPWKDFAILYRSNPQSRVFEEALRARKIPYQIVGTLSFLDRKEIKNVLACWRLVANPGDDAALRRVLNWPARGIGPTSLEALAASAFQKGRPLFDELENVGQIVPRVKVASMQFRERFLNLRSKLESCSLDSESLSHWAKSSLEILEVKKALEDESGDPVQFSRKKENVEELIHSFGQFGRFNDLQDDVSAVSILGKFLNRMTLEAQEGEEESLEDETNEVTLLTLHGAKGLEYPIVFLVGMEEGYLPHRKSIEESTDLSEERRLCYVGITRAKDHLILTRAKHRIRYGKKVLREVSRVLKAIPPNLIN